MIAIARLCRLGTAIACCAVVAAWLLPHPLAAGRALGTLLDHSSDDRRAVNELTLALSSLVAWALIIWLATTVLMLLATRLPGRIGAAARGASCLIIPAIVRRLLCGAVSISLASGILAGTAQAASESGPDSGSRATTTQSAATPNLDWPQPQSTQLPSGEQEPHPANRTGVDRASRQASQEGLPAQVTVRRGDSLWVLAGDRLEPGAPKGAIAREWPRWWERNRDVIGENPHLIYPGQVLHAPTPSE